MKMERNLFILILSGCVLGVLLENINDNDNKLVMTTESSKTEVNLEKNIVLNETVSQNINASNSNSHSRNVRSPQFYIGFGNGFLMGGFGLGNRPAVNPGFAANNAYRGNYPNYGGSPNRYSGSRIRPSVTRYDDDDDDNDRRRKRSIESQNNTETEANLNRNVRSPQYYGGYGAGYGAGYGGGGGGGNYYNGGGGGGNHFGGGGGDDRRHHKRGGRRHHGGGGGWRDFGNWVNDGLWEEYAEHTKRKSERRYEEYWKRLYETGMADETEPLTTQDLNGRIVAAPGEYRHMAVIGLRGADRKKIWKCGGSLIDFNFVLTAAHCTDFGGMPPTHVKIGDINLKIREGTVATQRMRIEAIYRHPKYKKNSYYYDIALIRLSKPAVWTRHVRPARLWTYNDYPIDVAYALGYGATKFGKAPIDVLTFLNLTMISNKKCKSLLPSVPETKRGIIDSQICAMDLQGIADTCQGDSGGPLQLHLPGRRRTKFYIIGITSYGLFCGSRAPSVYTRIYPFLDWIEAVVWPQYRN